MHTNLSSRKYQHCLFWTRSSHKQHLVPRLCIRASDGHVAPGLAPTDSSHAQHQSQIANRLLPACALLLPLTDGMFRLVTLAAGHIQKTSLDLSVWSTMQAATTSTMLSKTAAVDALRAKLMANDVVALERVWSWSSALYSQASQSVEALASISKPLLNLPSVVPQAIAAPAATDAADMSSFLFSWVFRGWGSIECLWSSTVLLLTLVTLYMARQQIEAKQQLKEQDRNAQVDTAADKPQPVPAWFVDPQLAVAACLSALLLRVSSVAQQPLSASLTSVQSLYMPAVVALTVVTCWSVSMLLGKILFSPSALEPSSSHRAQEQWHRRGSASSGQGKLRHQLLTSSLRLSSWHRSLATFDVLCTVLLTSLPMEVKLQALAAFLAYSLGLDWLTSQAEAAQ